VLGMVERGGKARAEVVAAADRHALQHGVRSTVEPGSTVYTDQHPGYKDLRDIYDHATVNHAETYVDGRVHTNGIENFWSLLKRGLHGTYVSVEPFHLFRYLDEQCFRFNNRATKDNPMDDGDRFSLLCSQIVGKRLTYAELTAKEGEKPEATC